MDNWENQKKLALEELEKDGSLTPRIGGSLIGGFLATIVALGVGMTVLETVSKSMKEEELGV